MFLFPNTKNRICRIGKNLVVYGLGGVAVCMLLSFLLPQVVADYVYPFTAVCSYAFAGGCLMVILSVIIRAFALTKSPSTATPPQPKKDYRDMLLLDEGDHYEGTQIALRFFNNGDLSVVNTGWWMVHRGAGSGGQTVLSLDTDYFEKNSIEDFIQWLTEQYHKDFSHLKERPDVLALFENSPSLPKLDIRVGEYYRAGSTERYLSLRKNEAGYYIHEYAWDYNAHKEIPIDTFPILLSSYSALVTQLKERYPPYEINRYVTNNPQLWQVFLDESINAMTVFLRNHHYDVETHLGTLSVVKHNDDPYNSFNRFIAKTDGVYNYIEVSMGGYRLTKRLSCNDLTVASFVVLAKMVIEAAPQDLTEEILHILCHNIEYVLQHTADHDRGQWIIDNLAKWGTETNVTASPTDIV